MNEKGFLDYEDFLRFFCEVYKGYQIEENIKQLWDGLDVDGNNEMEIDEFVDITEMMAYWPRIYEISYEYWDKVRNWILHYTKLDDIVHNPKYQYTVLSIVLMNTICVILLATTNPSDTNYLSYLFRLIDFIQNQNCFNKGYFGVGWYLSINNESQDSRLFFKNS